MKTGTTRPTDRGNWIDETDNYETDEAESDEQTEEELQ